MSTSRKLPPWCKLVKHTLIEKDIGVTELAKALGLQRPYLSAVINGRVYSPPAISKVSDFLGISSDYDTEYHLASSISSDDEN